MDAYGKCILELRRLNVETLQEKTSRVGSNGTSDLNRALVMWLESCQHYGAAPPQELIEMIARQLKVAGESRNQVRLKKQREIVLMACALDPNLSNKKLARALGVSLPTIAQWKKLPWFEPARSGFARFFARITNDEKETILKEEVDYPWLQELSHSPHPR